MKCQCGGTIKKIGNENYQCEACRTKIRMAYIYPSQVIKPPTIIDCTGIQTYAPTKEYMDRVNAIICNAFKIPSGMLMEDNSC